MHSTLLLELFQFAGTGHEALDVVMVETIGFVFFQNPIGVVCEFASVAMRVMPQKKVTLNTFFLYIGSMVASHGDKS
jgi:hypothetical protein